MSLINQLLKDLEKRHADGEEIKGISPQARSLPERGANLAKAIGIGALAVAVILAIFGFYHWQGRIPQAPGVTNPAVLMPAESSDTEPMQDAKLAPQAPAVEEALLAPVFQLSQELSFVPQEPAQPQTAGATLAQAPAVAKEPAPQQSSKNQKPAKSTAVAAQAEQASTPKTAPAKALQKPPTPKNTAAKSAAEPLSKPSKQASSTQQPSVADQVEEVVIGAGSPSAPIEKQNRGLTSYELAEIEFRNGVTRLKQGRLGEAEASFRAALREDRSHLPARQALIGLLIDMRRNQDAEQVVRDALAFNPRQPRHAMLLARLELDRGDAAAAVATLEAVKPYAGVDAEFYAFFAAALQRAGRYREAAELYKNALAVEPGNAIWTMGLGISLRAAGQPDEAREAFRRAAESRSLAPELQRYVEAQSRELAVRQR